MTTTVSAIVVNYNGGDDLSACLDALAGQDGLHEVIVVDNCSVDGSADAAAGRTPPVLVVRSPANVGFAGAVGQGARRALGDVLLILNPDVRVEPGCVAALRDAVVARDGVAGPVLAVEATGQHEYGWTINRLGMPRPLVEPRPPFFVPGCALATTRRTFEAVGGLDDRYFLFVEDLEYCWRVLLAGGEVQVVDAARAWHRGGGSLPGGYVTGGRGYTTSDARVALRERNTIAAMLGCAPGFRVPWVVAACAARSVGIAVVALLMRRPQLAAAVVGGLVWNARNAPGTLRRRRSLQVVPGGAREAAARTSRGWFLLDVLRHHGLPRFAEPPAPDVPTSVAGP